jgi:hypothetical protein
MSAKMQWIIVRGNPADGFEYVGPFQSGEAANAYQDADHDRGMDWWVVLLQAPARGSK